MNSKVTPPGKPQGGMPGAGMSTPRKLKKPDHITALCGGIEWV